MRWYQGGVENIQRFTSARAYIAPPSPDRAVSPHSTHRMWPDKKSTCTGFLPRFERLQCSFRPDQMHSGSFILPRLGQLVLERPCAHEITRQRIGTSRRLPPQNPSTSEKIDVIRSSIITNSFLHKTLVQTDVRVPTHAGEIRN